ncbi:MAG TPA: MFS transporter [Patescibacteria group bacterium]|nr:MFS transporter [Patescibacteria group bacterium]
MSKQVSKMLVWVMALGTFVVVLDNTIMNVSISSLVPDLHTTVSGVQAAISLNALMMAAFVLMGGKLADIIGMKKTFLLGAMLYVSGSLLASFSNNLTIFILGWCAIQGLGAAMMLPNVNTIIRANVTGKSRTQAYGLMAGVNALGTAIGPLVGGFLTTYFSWRWAFRLEVFILGFVLIMSGVIPKDKLAKKVPKLDKVGVAWQSAAMMFLVLGTLLISDYGLIMAKQPLVIFGKDFAPLGLSIVPILWILGLLCLWKFVGHEKRVEKSGKNPLVNLQLFANKIFTRGLSIRFIQVSLIAGTTFAVPLFLQVTYGLSAFETGLILLGLTAGLLITALGGAKRGLQYLPKQKIEWGFMVSILGLIVMGVYMLVGNAPVGLLPGLFIYGLGLGLIASQIVNLILSSIPPKDTAEASGVTSTLETLGSSVGTAIVGTLLVVAITGGATRLVSQSTGFTPAEKTQVSQSIPASVEIVSNSVVSEKVQATGAKEAEIVNIYDQARQNAFVITVSFMAFAAFVAYLLARRLPDIAANPESVTTV